MLRYVYGLVFLTIFANSIEIDTEKFQMGNALYKETCVSCHGVDGKANTSMNLIVKPRDLSKSILNIKQIYNVIKEGGRYWGAKADIMPGFKYVYNEEQLEAVSYYIYKKFTQNVQQDIKKLLNESEKEPIGKNKKMAKWGKKIFKRNCKFCHGEEGHGDGVATKNPVDSIYPYDLTKTLLTKKQIFLYVKYGGKHFGTFKDDMPSWKAKYDDNTLKSVAKYINDYIIKK